MNRIRRVLLSRVGYKSAWYDGVVLPFHDRDGATTDTIISLPNGEGKTTLLSLLMCSFDTSQRRFIQHLQKPHQHFRDYFGPQPGFIVIEMERPARGGNLFGSAANQRLVIGQMVTVRDPRSDPERHFFLFDPNAELDFDQLPLRGLRDGDTIDSPADWRAWLHQAREQNPSLWTTQNQHDWEQRLDEEGVDPWLAQRQVEFCSSEGGIDGFLNFRSEAEFLARFYHMALEEERAASVRVTLSDALVKLKSEPALKDQIGALRHLQTVFQPFLDSARERAAANQRLQQAHAVTAGLYQALSERVEALSRDTMTLDQDIQAGERQLRQTSEDLRQQTRRHEALQDLRHRRLLAEADSALVDAKQAIDDAGQQTETVNAAAALAEWRAKHDEIDNDEQALLRAADDLSPIREQARRHGSRLRARLQSLAGTRLTRAGERDAENTHNQGRIAELEQQEKQLRAEREQSVITLTRCDDALARRDTAHRALLDAQQIEPDETAEAGLARLRTTLTTLDEQITQTQTESTGLNDEHKQLTETRNQQRETRATLKAHLDGIDQQVQAGREQREALARHPRLRRLLGTERVDPDVGDLPTRIQERLQRLGSDAYDQRRRLDALERDRDSIEADGLSAASDDSRRVQELLREQGLADAQLYGHYLAELVPDVERAKALTLHDPARFGGVLVYSEQELERAKQLLDQPLGLRAPVVISLPSTGDDAASEASDRVVIPAAVDAAYNYAAAQDLLGDLERQRDALQQKLEKTKADREDYRSLQQRLATYLDDYGQGQLGLLETEQGQDREQLRRLDDGIEQARQRLDAIDHRLPVLAQVLEGLSGQRGNTESALQALQRFVDEHETGLVTLRSDRQQASEAMAAVDERLQRLAQEKQRLQTAITSNQHAAWQDKADAEQFQERHDAVTYHLEQEPGDDDATTDRLSEQELESAYQSACNAFETLSRERGLEALEAGIKEKRREEQRLQSRYRKAQGSLDPAPIEALLGQDLETLKADSQTRLQEALDQEKHWLAEQGERKGQYRAFKPKSIEKGQQPPGLESLEDLTLSAIDLDIQTTGPRREALTTQQQEQTREQKLRQDKADGIQQRTKLLNTRRTGIKPYLDPAISPQAVALPEDDQALDQLQQSAIGTQADAQKAREDAMTTASQRYDAVRSLVSEESFQRIEPRLAVDLQNNGIDAACDAATDLTTRIGQRIDTVQFELDKLEENVGTVIDRLGNLATEAIELLKKATSGTRVPERVPHFGGQPILKMSARFHRLEGEQRRGLLRDYLSRLVRENHLPKNGGVLAAELIGVLAGAMHADGRLGLRLLKPTDIGVEYMAVSNKVGSGGESLTAALLLYLVMAQLRGRSRAGGYDPNSGFLVLDNPLGTANKPALIRPQLELARHFGIQLIYTSGIQDYNALSQFSHLLRLRRISSDPLSGQAHVGVEDYAMVESLDFDITVNEAED